MMGRTSQEVGVMPKEVIHPRWHGSDIEPSPQVTVGWSREVSDVQIGVALPEKVTRPPQVGETTIRPIVDVLRDELTDEKWHNNSNYAQALETMVLVYEGGWFADLDRSGINRLIRTLRKARDAAFGADA
jgi:hypothetical protein